MAAFPLALEMSLHVPVKIVFIYIKICTVSNSNLSHNGSLRMTVLDKVL